MPFYYNLKKNATAIFSGTCIVSKITGSKSSFGKISQQFKLEKCLLSPFIQPGKGVKLKDDANELRRYYSSEWRTCRMCGHHLLWVRGKNDKSEAYLNNLVKV